MKKIIVDEVKENSKDFNIFDNSTYYLEKMKLCVNILILSGFHENWLFNILMLKLTAQMIK